MPANIVKEGQEKYWARAKEQAAKQGREDDYAYITGIFKKMVLNKSERFSIPADPIQKAFVIPPNFRQVRYHGSGVPSKEQRSLMAMVEKPAPDFNAMSLLDHNGPRSSVHDIVKGLFPTDPGQEQVWTKFLKTNVHGHTNELDMRMVLNRKMMDERLDAGLRKALFQRTMSFYRDLKKSTVQVFTPDELKKADARGGTYHKRVKGKTGKYRYYYDEDKYKASRDAHVSGPDAQKSYISKTLSSMVEKSGKEGCGVDGMKSLAKKYGAKAVGDSLRESCKGGSMSFKKGKFYTKAKPTLTAKVADK